MATALINGCNIWYETAGSGQSIIFTPGGRSPGSMMRTIADEMSSNYHTVIHDRRNCGASDVIISGEGSDQEIWADDMAQMIRQLDLGPAYLSGWSSGCRLSILTAIRYPELVKGLLLGWVTGGATAAERLAYQYYGQFIEAAEAGGMEAVAATEFFAEPRCAEPRQSGETSEHGHRRVHLCDESLEHLLYRWGPSSGYRGHGRGAGSYQSAHRDCGRQR